jgi:DNA-binding transcriptional LysR family regulator
MIKILDVMPKPTSSKPSNKIQPVRIPRISLEQWAAFKAVVDEGSYAKAAETLNKSQSAISYAITRLNTMLPAPALVLEGRKAALSAVGETLYRYASNLLEQAHAIEQTAEYLASGWESSITLVADALAPMPPLLCGLQEFSQRSPLTRIKILETSLSGTDEALLSRTCELALTPRVPPGFLGTPVYQITMIAVAQRNHPLAQMTSITEAELKNHRQIVVRDSGVKREQNAGWLGSEQRWTVSHFASSVETVEAGLGFAFLPEHRIRKSLESGLLVRLPLQIGGERHISLDLVMTQATQAGPGTQALAKMIIESFKNPLRHQPTNSETL